MAQIFSPRANTYARAGIGGAVGLVIAFTWTWNTIYWSPYTTWVNVPREQPVPFSHKHHVAGLGIDCRYCHTSVENSSFAGLPPTETCMTCHSQLWTNAKLLAPVRDSLATNTPIRWNRVNDLPDFVYFDHSIHIHKGIGCTTCHGPVDQMPLTWKANTLYMKWCIDCHRDPGGAIRPRDQVFSTKWQAPPDQREEGLKLVRAYHVNTSGQLTNCSMCHH